ncbi:MAG: alkyl hydroperoxide reductase/ Thiol specific antioxidant/ Mal allergen [Candidatus Parvarchaeum acidiphilum ARMAN-4]|jgi:peroxiredoxin Q/BCP|uniref:thioredoxin-dependent peroxiredoxin n=1 Tax=Candidatus Parvarchaeum acidiphilum ARMAN-4 TaxID=662760 RepID=D2EEC0_PARA4|nr:MAG: alkyl hydroperoxide reductase/ Thiol specific antioxidant/ Mal allergen [Candidatus Parvarchaeum acidiphilum ARMAN-4]
MEVKEGDMFPDFKLKADDGKEVSLSDLKGKKSVVYFYPKDDTPGCTKEACSFRDSINSFESQRIPVFGISVDSIESHKKFKNKYSIPFTLLSDSDKKVIAKLGIKSILGVASRVTFILDENGKILKIYPKVSPDKHAEEILAFLKKE